MNGSESLMLMDEWMLILVVNLDVTSYSDGKRETHNPGGRVHLSFENLYN